MPVSLIGLVEGMTQMPRLESGDDVSGFWAELPEMTDPGNGGTPYYKLKGDLWLKWYLCLRFSYNFEVILPKFYYKIPQKSGASDYTANLTISRVKFAVGQTGAVTFKLKSKGMPLKNTDGR